jgi:hypothetical protein
MQSENITIFCTNMLDTGTAFALRGDTGEQVFIPASVSTRAGLSIGDTATATIIPNHQHGDRTPWFAIHIEPVGEPVEAPATPVATIDDRIAEAIASHEGAYHTTTEIADMVSVDVTTASNALNRLFKQGRVARAEVHARGDQQRPSFCLWAENTDRFIDTE